MEYPRKFFADIDTSYYREEDSNQKYFNKGRADLHPVKYEESIGHDQTEIKEDYFIRMTFKFVEGIQNPNIKMQSRVVCYGDTEKAYKFGRGKVYSQDEAWKKLEDCMVNLSMVGKPHPIHLPELDGYFVEFYNNKWICYKRERKYSGTDLQDRTVSVSNYNELNTLDEALEKLSGKI